MKYIPVFLMFLPAIMTAQFEYRFTADPVYRVTSLPSDTTAVPVEKITVLVQDGFLRCEIRGTTQSGKSWIHVYDFPCTVSAYDAGDGRIDYQAALGVKIIVEPMRRRLTIIEADKTHILGKF